MYRKTPIPLITGIVAQPTFLIFASHLLHAGGCLGGEAFQHVERDEEEDRKQHHQGLQQAGEGLDQGIESHPEAGIGPTGAELHNTSREVT